MSKPITQNASPERERLEIMVARAAPEDVAAIRDLLIQHFGYIYVTLLGDDKDCAAGVLESILNSNGGRHPLGYKSFYVARPQNGRGKAAGILRLKMKRPAETFGSLISGLSVIKASLQKLGLRGAFRTLHLWLVIRGITPAVEANELHIVYLAVSNDALKQHVGKQLLEYARMIALSEGKEFMSLYVRAKNVNARSFFHSQGFSVEETVTDAEADNLLKQGASVRMAAAVMTPPESA